jgi:hypothetical protein
MVFADEHWVVTLEIPGDKTIEKIRAFANFPAGWHHGRGRPFAAQTISDAIELVSSVLILKNSEQSDAFPGTNGEIALRFYEGSDVHEFTIERTGRVEYAHEVDGVDQGDPILAPSVGPVNRLASIIPWLSSSTSFRTGTMTLGKSGLSVWPSSQAMMTAEFLRSAKNVLQPGTYRSARTSASSTQVYSKNLSSSFDLRQKNFRLDAA